MAQSIKKPILEYRLLMDIIEDSLAINLTFGKKNELMTTTTFIIVTVEKTISGLMDLTFLMMGKKLNFIDLRFK